jgi:hypothetical protein
MHYKVKEIARQYSDQTTGYTTGVRFVTGQNFSLRHINISSGTHPVDTWDLFPGAKRPGREANHSHQSGAEIKNAWSCYLHSPIYMNGVMLS